MPLIGQKIEITHANFGDMVRECCLLVDKTLMIKDFGFVAGLVASIRSTHWVDSNKESGRGRYDLILMPKDAKHSLGIIIEFKKTSQVDGLKTIAEEALDQINIKDYDTVLKRYTHIQDVLKIGLAFCDKAVVSAYQKENLLTHKKTALVLSKMVDNTDENDW